MSRPIRIIPTAIMIPETPLCREGGRWSLAPFKSAIRLTNPTKFKNNAENKTKPLSVHRNEMRTVSGLSFIVSKLWSISPSFCNKCLVPNVSSKEVLHVEHRRFSKDSVLILIVVGSKQFGQMMMAIQYIRVKNKRLWVWCVCILCIYMVKVFQSPFVFRSLHGCIVWLYCASWIIRSMRYLNVWVRDDFIDCEPSILHMCLQSVVLKYRWVLFTLRTQKHGWQRTICNIKNRSTTLPLIYVDVWSAA